MKDKPLKCVHCEKKLTNKEIESNKEYFVNLQLCDDCFYSNFAE